jgi:hypothetical protein
MDKVRMIALIAAALLMTVFSAGPVAAQEVITNPGKCAQYYPGANCQNYGPGNPYRGPYSYQSGWQNGYAWDNGYAGDRPPTYRYRRYQYQY